MKEREKLLKEIEELKKRNTDLTKTLRESSSGIKENNMKITGLEAALEQLGDEDVDALFEKFEKLTPQQREMFIEKIVPVFTLFRL